MAERRDPYEVLGVGPDASPEVIQRAYRTLARRYHPDVNKDPEAEERFKDVAEAYDLLSDPDLRRRYDAFGPEFRNVPEGMDPETWSRVRSGATAAGGTGPRWGGGRGAGPSWTAGMGGMGAEDIDLEDLFGSMFGAGQRRGRGPVAGADQEIELEVSVEEAFHGGRRSLSLSGPGGTRTIEVTIPAGVADGQRIRLGGQGGRGTGGAAPGDLYLVVRIAPHPRYRVEGRNVFVDLPLAPWEGALGASVAVDTPGGEAKVRVTPGTSTGRRLRLRGRGIPNPKGSRGDLYAEARIMVPRKLTDDERRLFEELGRVSTFDPRRGR